MEMIQGALDFWNFVFERVYYLLTLDLQGFSPTVYSAMQNINTALQAFGYGFLVIFTLLEIVRTCTDFRELQRPEYVLKVFMRFILTKYIIGYGFTLVNDLFGLLRGVIESIFTAGGMQSIDGVWQELTVPAELTDGLGNFLMDTINKITMNLFNLLPTLLIIIMYIVMLVLAVTLILQVYGRFFKLFMFVALSPLPLSTFGSRETSSMGKSYIKSFTGACLEGGIIALAIVVFAAYMQSPWLAFDWQNTTSGLGGIFSWAGTQAARLAYCFNLMFNMLVFLGTVKASDRLVHRLMGV